MAWSTETERSTSIARERVWRCSLPYVMLFPLPGGHNAQAVRTAWADTVQRLPEHLWQSLTRGQGKEIAQHTQFTIDAGVQVQFCDPKSSWQRGSNENTNWLLRQYFPKRHRYVGLDPGRSRCRSPLPQRPTSTNPRMDDTIREARRSVAVTPRADRHYGRLRFASSARESSNRRRMCGLPRPSAIHRSRPSIWSRSARSRASRTVSWCGSIR